ncbi:MAG: MATE family efflux transporter [Burkholderiales bacterium]|nr:MATE family efflux transporter [Burkholderiales bacterium]MDP2398160.1 MATE family efflux transporter [Burkholderiales bacterium]
MAGPIILANISVPLLGAVHTAVVGHLPEPYYLGAVAIGAMLFNFIYHLFNCLRMGTTGPTAQARGAGDYAEVRAMLSRALLLATAIGGVLVLLQLPILATALWLINASAEVEHHAGEYFRIRVWAMPAVLASYAIIGWLYGLRDARLPLLILFVTNGVNIALSLWFVLGLGWGVPGVAIASLIAEYTGLVAGLLCVLRVLRRLPDDGRRSRVLDPACFARMLAINGDIVVRTFCVVSVLAFFMAKSAELGDVQLAANQVLYTFLMFTSFGLDGFAHAAEAILGESVGRRNREAFRRNMRVVFLWAGLVAALNAVVYVLAGPAIIALLTGIPEVRAAAETWLLWPALLPLVGVWAYTYDGVYLAATRTRIMRNTVLLSFMVFLLVLHLAMPLFGNAGLWGALAVFLGLRGVLLHLFMPRVLKSI